MKEHSKAVARAADFFSMIARARELPVTPRDLDQRIAEFNRNLDRTAMAGCATMIATMLDQPCPQQLFAPWASKATIWKWRNLPPEKNPLCVAVLNGKIMVAPTEFFRALSEHGQPPGRAHKGSPTL